MTVNTLRRKTALAPKRSISLVKKKFTMFRCKVRSMHPSHSPLRRELPLLPFKSVIRLGSTTIEPDVISLGGNRVECNTIAGVRNSSSKLLMKQCFTRAGVKTAEWWRFAQNSHTSFQFYKNITNTMDDISELPYPIIAKTHQGSRGNGNTKLDTQEQLETWMRGKTLSNYIFERFIPMKLEFRFHANKNGVFYVCRKALKEDAPQDRRWCMNDANCVWYIDTNEKFFKPNSYNDIEQECVKALHSLGLDFCAFDVRVQSFTKNNGTSREYQDFFIVEGNSAPSFAEITLQKYLEQIPIILKEKYILS